MTTTDLSFSGWHLLGAFPNDEPDDVGSWLLIHGGEAMLLEIPPGLGVEIVRDSLRHHGATLRYVTASHDHEDHFDPDAWGRLRQAFSCEFIHPSSVAGDRLLHLGDEPLWLIKGAKHSMTDLVTVFRGIAMTGDIELGTLDTVNDEVPLSTKRRSMNRLRGFEQRADYHVHSIVSAHLNDVRRGIRWADLFTVDE